MVLGGLFLCFVVMITNILFVAVQGLWVVFGAV